MDINKIFCPKCGSKAFYTKLSGKRRCKKCGNVYADEEVK